MFMKHERKILSGCCEVVKMSRREKSDYILLDAEISKLSGFIPGSKMNRIATEYLGLHDVQVENLKDEAKGNNYTFVSKCFFMWKNMNQTGHVNIRKHLVEILQKTAEQGWVKLDDFRFLDLNTFEWPKVGKPKEEAHLGQRLLQKISKKVSTDQEMLDLGISLDIPMESIKSARTDNQTSINAAVMDMLYFHWYKDFNGTTEQAQGVLRNALNEAELGFIVEELKL